MTVHKSHRSADGDEEPELVTVDLGGDTFQAELIVARLAAEGVQLGTWDNGLQSQFGRVPSNQLLVRKEDLPAVQAAMADAGLAP